MESLILLYPYNLIGASSILKGTKDNDVNFCYFQFIVYVNMTLVLINRISDPYVSAKQNLIVITVKNQVGTYYCAQSMSWYSLERS